MENTEKIILAHRYLYYVMCSPVISDGEYDILERQARKGLSKDSPVRKPGSDLASSYSKEVIKYAEELYRALQEKNTKVS